MKFKVNKKTLLENIKIINQMNINNIYSPIFQSVLITVEKKELTFVATNGFISSKIVIKNDFECIEEGNVLIKFKILFNIIQKLDNLDLIFERIDNSVIKISSEKFDSNINVLDSQEFPIINFSHENWKEVNLKTIIIKDVYNKLLQSVSSNKEQNSILSGVCFQSNGELLEIFASDSFRLSYLNFNISTIPFKVVIDPSLINLISENVIATDSIKLYLNGFNLLIKINDSLFSSKVIDGDYPNINQIISSPKYNEVSISKKEIINALERGIVLTTTEKKPIVKLSILDNQIKVYFRSLELGNSEEIISCSKITGDNINISLNANYLISLLKVFNNDEIILGTSTENKPVILSSKEEENFIQLLLPIRNI